MESIICRTCLEKKATISVFEVADSVQYSTKIMKCVSVEISEQDSLPKLMCSRCVEELNVAYEFIQKCEAADSALRCLPLAETELQLKDEFDIKQEDIKLEFNETDTLDHDFIEEQVNEPQTNKQKYTKRKKRQKLGPIQCLVCGLMVASPSALEIHTRTHTGEKPFSCKLCLMTFPTKGALKRHIEIKHSKRERKFTCETCGSNFYSKNEIKTHIRVHTQEKPFVCPFCSMQFRQVSSLIRHKRIHTGEKPYACPICDKRFRVSNLVKKHLSVHSEERKYSCHVCNKGMKSKNSLATHIKTIHSNEKQNVCSFCGMTFTMKGNLAMHIKRKHSQKSGDCMVCLKTFSDLETHMRKHTGEKPFVCDECSQGYASKRSLAHHMVFKHKNASKFKCSIGECTKTFPTAMMLEFHLLKQHTNHTPYICQHCSRGFFRMSDLTRHLKVSHMDIQIKMPIKTLVLQS